MELDELYYLKQNIVIEPLVDQWYAWSHLISPATAAMNIYGRHLKIMNSFVQAPQIHQAAVRNPKMLGGPFMDISIDRVDEIKCLRDETVKRKNLQLEFVNAIKTLNQLLKNQAKGFSLEPLYGEIPNILKGFIELVYDLNGFPAYRIYETLLYKSEFYDESGQSIILWETTNDERPFVLSTPRLDSENTLHINVPFKHKAIDTLSEMKRIPQSLQYIREVIDVPEKKIKLFNSFFTKDKPINYVKYIGDNIRMRYFGHACVLIETDEISILIDPVVSYYGYQTDVNRFSDADLPDVIDYILITHNHQDHILFETLLPLRHKTKNLIVPNTTNGFLQDPNLKLMFTNIGFTNVHEIKEFDELYFKDCTITGIPFIGEHSDLNINSKLCYLVKIHSFKILFMADSRNILPDLYEKVNIVTGDVDVLMLGMECDGAPLTWLYGPLLTEELARDKDQSRRLSGSNFINGKSLVDIFKPSEVYVYAMGQEPWLQFISSIKYDDSSNPIIQSNKLITFCKEKGLIAERLFGEKEIIYKKRVL